MTMAEKRVLIESDARSRVTLPGTPPGTRYLMHQDPDGTVVLAPAVVITELERRFLDSGLPAAFAEADRRPQDRRDRPARRIV